MSMSKPPATGTTLPFGRLTPRDFERLSLWLIEREGFENAQHLGAAGSEQGRDIVAWREGKLWAFQCKRVQSFSPTHALAEVDRISCFSPDERPSVLMFLVTCHVPALTRDMVRTRCKEVGLECGFWTAVELDEKVKQHSEILQEFFSPALAHRIVLSEELRNKVIHDSGGTCSICGRVGVPLDVRHIVPMSSGGTNTYENLQAVCRSCHVLMDGLGVELDEAREIASSAYRLETLVTRVLREAGFAVIAGVTGPDAGVDIVAQIAEPGTSELRTLLVECRGGHEAISSSEVVGFAAKLKQYDGDFGVIVSNEDPTFEAIDVARNFGISIISEEKLSGFVQDVQGGDYGQ